MKCIFSKNFKNNITLPNPFQNKKTEDYALVFPERNMSLNEQSEFNPNNYDKHFVITNSPFIVSCFKQSEVLILNDDNSYEHSDINTFGASFDVLFLALNKNTSMLPKLVIEEIKENLNKDKQEALSFVQKLGDSMDKAYLLRKLEEELKK